MLRCKLKKLKCRTPDNLSDIRHFYKLLFFVFIPITIIFPIAFARTNYFQYAPIVKKFQIVMFCVAVIIFNICKIFGQRFLIFT